MVRHRVNREHSSNFNAGYINIDEQYLHKTGVRGRKAYFLYGLVFILIALTLLNILVSYTLFGGKVLLVFFFNHTLICNVYRNVFFFT